MKSINKILAVLLLAVMLLALASCGTSTDTSSENEPNTTDSDTKTDITTDTSTESKPTDSDKPADSNQPTDTDTGAGEITDPDTPVDPDTPTDTPVDSDKPTPDPDPEPEPEPDPEPEPEPEPEPDPEPEPEPEPAKPTPETLNIIKDGKSDYAIVYKNTDICRKYAQELRAHIKSAYSVELRLYTDRSCPSSVEHRIYVGKSHDDIEFVKDEIGDSNDFAVTVLGDDLVLYAPNDYLYGYMLALAKEKILVGGNELVVKPEDSFTLATSPEKDYTYAEYLKSKGSFNLDKLLLIFEEGSYTYIDTTLKYRIYVPSDYDSSKQYPVVTILHGAGERGDDNVSQLKNMVSELFNQKDSKYMDAIVICPQCPSGQQWVDTPWENGNYSVEGVPESDELKAAFGIVEWAKYNLAADMNRFYIMGLSMGGFGTWDMIMRHRDSFAAAVPLCGGADVSYVEYLKDFPIWAVHSSNDTSVPYIKTRQMYDALKATGSTSFIFEEKTSGHNVWGYAGNSTEIADWLFQQGLTH